MAAMEQSDKACLRGRTRVCVGRVIATVLFSACTISHAEQQSGSAIYQKICIGCHATTKNAPTVGLDLLQFKGDDSQFLEAIKNGRAGTLMPPWKSSFSDNEIMNLRAYLREEASRQQPVLQAKE